MLFVLVIIVTVLYTDPRSFKLADISYRLRFSFVSFACIVRSFFVFRSFAFRSCNWFVRFVYRSFRASVRFVYRSFRSSVYVHIPIFFELKTK
jgi:hypothetical protein